MRTHNLTRITKYILIFFTLIIFVLRCEIGERREAISFPETIKLPGTSIGPEGKILNPVHLEIIDSILVVSLSHSSKPTNNLLKLYCLKTNKVLSSFGRFGNGPGELRDVSDIEIDAIKREIIVFDQLRQKFFYFQLDSLLNVNNYIPEIIQAPKGILDLYNFCKNNNGLFVANGDINSLLTFFTESGKILLEKKEYPIIDNNIAGLQTNIPDEALKSFFIGNVTYDIYLERVYIAYLYFDLIEVYNLQGERLNFFKNSTNYAVHKKGDIYRYNLCYYDIVVDDKFVYALYSGYELSLDYDDWRQGKTIHVFDKELNPVRKYELDRPISSIVVDSDNRIIYGVSRYLDVPLTVFNY